MGNVFVEDQQRKDDFDRAWMLKPGWAEFASHLAPLPSHRRPAPRRSTSWMPRSTTCGSVSQPPANLQPAGTRMTRKAPGRTAERILEVTLELFNRFDEPNVSTTLMSAELGIRPVNL